MFLNCAGALGLYVAALSATPQIEEMSLRDLSVGQRLEVRTEARVYRLTVIDPKTGETEAAVSADGISFSQPAKVYFLGATHGRQPGLGEMLVLMGQVRQGLRIELGLGSLSRFDRAVTEPVTAVRLLDSVGE
jgi:hypothetical protein